MIIGAVVIVGYTVMGGFMAVSTTDLIQSVVMSISLIVIVFYGIHMAGGWNEVVNNATSLAGYLSMTQLHDRAADLCCTIQPVFHYIYDLHGGLATSVCPIFFSFHGY